MFMDDLNIHNSTWDSHLCHIKMVLQRLKDVNLKLNPTKCVFAAKSIKFLGHIVEKEGIKPNLEKIKVVVECPVPKIVANVHVFLGLTKY
jgi:hypothetical protein